MLSSENEASTVEATMKDMMIDYIDKCSYSISCLIADANINTTDHKKDCDIFNDMNLKVIIGMYCSPGLKFEAKQFKEDLEQCEVKKINAIKIYHAMQELSKSAVKYNNSIITPPVVAITGSRTAATPDAEVREDDLNNASIDLGNLMQEGADIDADVQLEGEDYLGFIVRTEI